jgi:serine/threonine-protein kinase RsbT
LKSATAQAIPRRVPVAAHVCCDMADRYLCANLARAAALACGFTEKEAAEVAVCAAELASNAVRHGRRGVLEVFLLEQPLRGIELRCEDEGPGFADPVGALQDGWSRGHMFGPDNPAREGLGTGLGAIRRFMDELEIGSGSSGTIVTAKRFR